MLNGCDEVLCNDDDDDETVVLTVGMNLSVDLNRDEIVTKS